MVKMEPLEPPENLETMEHLGTLETKEILVIRDVMQLPKIAVHAHHLVLPKDSRVILVCQAAQDNQESQALKDNPVKMVIASLEKMENLVNLVNQVNRDKMVSQVYQANPADQEIMLASENLSVLVQFFN